MTFRTVILATFFIVLIGSIVGGGNSHMASVSDSTSTEQVATDIDDANVRENPVIEHGDDEIDIKVPSYINQNSNHIQMNGADWTPLRKALAQCQKTPFSIVHLGDSHLQADISTGAIREFLQYDYGNAGRGLVIPFRLARTNEPWDYSISSNHSWRSAKVLKRPWDMPMGFTGISIRPATNYSDLFVATREDADYNPFNLVTIFHAGTLDVQSVENREGKDIRFSQQSVAGGTLLKLGSEESGVRLHFNSSDLVVHGMNLSGNRPGVFYHTIGNNGAAFYSYDAVPEFGEGIGLLHPNLIIVSLGTNDSFGRFDAKSFNRYMDSVIKKIRNANPSAVILLTTPMECQKSVYSSSPKKVKKRVRGKNGKWTYKYVNASSSQGHAVNDNVARVRNEIVNYAKNNNISLYDWYEVAGGQGASKHWTADELFGSDKVHHTAKGYRLTGYLLYMALSEAFKAQ